MGGLPHFPVCFAVKLVGFEEYRARRLTKFALRHKGRKDISVYLECNRTQSAGTRCPPSIWMILPTLKLLLGIGLNPSGVINLNIMSHIA